jgi:hypothetical protein
MSFLSKVKGWFGKKEETPVPSQWNKSREDFKKVFESQSGTYEQKAEQARSVIKAGPEAIAQATRSNVVELVPRAGQEKRKLSEMATAYIKREDDPIMGLLKKFTGVQEVDRDYLLRIKHELIARPESFKDLTCFVLEDYLRAVHTPYNELQTKAEAILNNAYDEMAGVESVQEEEEEYKKVVGLS